MKLIDKDALVAWAEKTYLYENASMIRKICYKQLLEFLDTLEVKELQEEPVSKDLEDEIAKFNNNYFPETDNGLNIEMRKELRTIVGNAIKNGVQWKEQQMMQNAVSAYIIRNKYTKKNVLNGFDVTCESIQKFKDKDKVKVIIIKQE